VLIGKINTLIWFRSGGFLHKEELNGKETMRRRGPTLVGTPKGTSHW